MGDTAETALFFALRTSVELFEDPASPDAVVRAKQAACLYDRLIFEPGLLDVTIASNGSMPFWYPIRDLTPEQRERARRPIPLDSPVSFAMGRQPAEGIPARPEEMRAFPLGGLNLRYVAEFYTGILDDLAQFDPDWVSEAGGGAIDRSHPIGGQVARDIEELNRQDRWDRSLIPALNDWTSRYVSESFNRDSTIASQLGAAFNITPMFQPMVSRRSVMSDHPGSEALGYVVPNVGRLPWEAVVEFRDHPGSREARAQLREFERRAAQDAVDAYDFIVKVGQDVTSALFAALDAQRPSLPEELAKEALLGAVEVVPGVGPLVSKSAAVTQKVREDQRLRRHWTSALMLLRNSVNRSSSPTGA